MGNQLLTGLWQSGSGSRYVWYRAPWLSFMAKWSELASGMRLCSLDAAQIDGQTLWSGVWEFGGTAQEIASDLSWAQLQGHIAQHAATGRYVHGIRSHAGLHSPSWAAYWLAADSPSIVLAPMPWSQFWSAWLTQHSNGNLLQDFDTYGPAGGRMWTGVWRPGLGDQFIWIGASWSEFKAKDDELRESGYRLWTARVYDDGRERRWAGVWRRSTGLARLVADLTENQFWDEWRAQSGRGLRLSKMQVWDGGAYAGQGVAQAVLRLHLKILTEPAIPIARMLDRMREVVRAGRVSDRDRID